MLGLVLGFVAGLWASGFDQWVLTNPVVHVVVEVLLEVLVDLIPLLVIENLVSTGEVGATVDSMELKRVVIGVRAAEVHVVGFPIFARLVVAVRQSEDLEPASPADMLLLGVARFGTFALRETLGMGVVVGVALISWALA